MQRQFLSWFMIHGTVSLQCLMHLWLLCILIIACYGVFQSLLAIRSLLQLASTEALVFKEFCGLDEALERMQEQLEGLKEEEFQRDYVRDMEILRREVESIFHRKLEKVGVACASLYVLFICIEIPSILFDIAGCAGSNVMWCCCLRAKG